MFKKSILGADIVKNNKMKMVHDKELKQLLQSLEVYDDVVNGQCECLFCHAKITLDNIDAIVPHEGQVCFTCDKKSCHSKLIGWGE